MPKLKLKLVNRQMVGDRVYLLSFYSDLAISFKPGQFLSFKIADGVLRSYSILDLSNPSPFFDSSVITSDNQNTQTKLDGSFISFIVNTRQAGVGSTFMEQAEIGFEVEAIGPAGRFGLEENNLDKVFVCTGTGLAPFIPMIKQVLARPEHGRIDLYFGVKNSKDKFVNQFFSESELSKINTYISLSSEEPGLGEYKGFVNEAILANIQSFDKQEFYLCGNPLMIDSVKNLLELNQADKIYFEKYS